MRHALFLALTAAIAAPPATAQPRELVWANEFNGSLEDALTDWSFQLGNGCPQLCGWGNNEIQIYTDTTGKEDGNLFIDDGSLVLVARQSEDGGFTSARIRTAGKKAFTYGYVEIRATVPSTAGVWPALWMLPDDSPYGGWPLGGEIDIMESADTADKIQGTCHFGSAWPNNQNNGGSIEGDYDDGYHVFAVDWQPGYIRWYLDGNLYHEATRDQWYTDAAKNDPQAPFDTPFYFLFNIAVGGNFVEDDPADGDWPQEMRIDYVRVYDKK